MRDSNQLVIGTGSDISNYYDIWLHYKGDEGNAYNDVPYIGKLVIGNNTKIGQFFKADVYTEVKIGDDCLLASNIYILTVMHSMNPEITASYVEQPMLIPKRVEICDGAWIGERVSILPGVTIGKKSIIGTGAVVTKDIPEYSIAVGNPARVIKQWNFNLKKWIRV